MKISPSSDRMNGMKEKRLDFELLRLIAIFGVVFNHSQLRGFELFMLPSCTDLNYVLSLTLGVLCKMAVPLFLLVSGGLLLHREEPISAVLKKRALRIFCALVLFSLILYLFWIRWGNVETPGIGDFLSRLWGEGISRPYWYLYAYLGLMLMLPLLRPMAQNLKDRAFLYLTALHLGLYGILYSLGTVLNWGPVNGDLWLPLIEPTLFYFLMGYYLAHRFPWEKVTRRHLLVMVLASAIAVILTAFLAHIRFRTTGEPGEYLESLLAIPIFTLYALVHQLFANHTSPGWVKGFLSAFGGCAFGTYLLEGILRHYWEPVYNLLEPKIHVIPACLVWVFLVAVSGLLLTWLLKKLPLLRKIL